MMMCLCCMSKYLIGCNCQPTLLQPYLQNHKFKVVVPIFLRVMRVVDRSLRVGCLATTRRAGA